MNETACYENFPAWIVVLCNLASLSIYAIGAYILFRLAIWLLVVYLAYCLWLEARVLRASCVNCYYYGKVCGFGKGKLCSMFFKRGDPQRMASRQVRWWDILPDLLVSILPLVIGIIFLILRFEWLLVVLLVALLLLSSIGNAAVRGSLACRYCRQKAIGCPAEKLFNQGHPTGVEGSDD